MCVCGNSTCLTSCPRSPVRMLVHLARQLCLLVLTWAALVLLCFWDCFFSLISDMYQRQHLCHVLASKCPRLLRTGVLSRWKSSPNHVASRFHNLLCVRLCAAARKGATYVEHWSLQGASFVSVILDSPISREVLCVNQIN